MTNFSGALTRRELAGLIVVTDFLRAGFPARFLAIFFAATLVITTSAPNTIRWVLSRAIRRQVLWADSPFGVGIQLAQHESSLMSMANDWAASFSPSFIVRYGTHVDARASTLNPALIAMVAA